MALTVAPTAMSVASAGVCVPAAPSYAHHFDPCICFDLGFLLRHIYELSIYHLP